MNDNLNNNQDVNTGLDNNQNVGQNDYYNNDAYYDNSNYSDNYNNTSYEEEDKKKGTWWKILLAILVLLIIIILLLKFCGGGKSNETKYTELQTKLCTAANKYVELNPTVIDKTKPGTVTVIKLQRLSDANLIESRIENPNYNGSLFKKSTESKYYSMNNSVRLTVHNDGTLNCEMVDNSSDVTAPELRLNGDLEITYAIGTNFEDPGYTATDDYDGDITSNVVRSGNVDSAKAGEYTITYSVSDSAGNTTTKTRKVIYEEYPDLEITLGSILDTVTPMISLKGSNPYCMVKGTQYVEPGAIATDNVDGDITNRISVTNKVSGNLLGPFRIIYKVEDSSGNQAIAYRAVLVTTECPEQNNNNAVANNAPTINVLGTSSVTITKGTQYIDKGAEAYDKEDGDITNKIITDTSAVNENVAGVYTVHYKVTDSAGAIATAVRKVTVKGTVSGTPSVRFTKSPKNITVAEGKGSNELLDMAKAVDENGNNITLVRKFEEITATERVVSAIDWNIVGNYRVTYTATHRNGQISQSESAIITIKEGEISITGNNPITIPVRKSNCDLTVEDVVNGGVKASSTGKTQPIIRIEKSADRMACLVGTYEDVVVSAKTSNTNKNEKKITVIVADGEGNLNVAMPSKTTVVNNSQYDKSTLTDELYNTYGKWIGGEATSIALTVEATPQEGTTLAKFEWSKDCSTPSGEFGVISGTNTGSYSFTNEGKNDICIRAVTTANIKGSWSEPIKIYIDRTGPKVEFTHSWSDEEYDWYNTPTLTVTYDASDTESGLDHFEYTFDDVRGRMGEKVNNPNTIDEASGKLTLNENSESERNVLFVYVRAVDKADNPGEWTLNPAFVNIDTIAPYAPTLTVEGNKTSMVKIKADFKDGESVRASGFGKLIYTIDAGEEKEETSKIISVPANTTEAAVNNTIKVWSVDKANNRSATNTETIVEVAPMQKPATGVTLKNGETTIKDAEACSASTIYVGDTFTLTASPIPVDADEKKATWGSSRAEVAVIDENGKVTIKKNGNAVITATIGSVKTTCIIESKSKVNSSPSIIYESGSKFTKLDSGEISYWMYVPINANNDTPLMIWLPGSGEATTKEKAFARGGLYSIVKNWDSYGLQNFDVFVVSALVNYSSNGTKFTNSDREKVMKVVDEVIKKYDINPKKVILAGHSSGGTEVVKTAALYKEKFSCLVPLSGYATCGSNYIQNNWDYFKSTPIKGYGEFGNVALYQECLDKEFTRWSNVAHNDIPKKAFTLDENDDKKSDLLEWIKANVK